VHDAGGVNRPQRRCQLNRQVQHFQRAHPPPREPRLQRLADQTLEHQARASAMTGEVGYGADMRIVDERERRGFVPELPVRLSSPARPRTRQFQCNRLVRPGVGGSEDHPHPARADSGQGLKAAMGRARHAFRRAAHLSPLACAH